MTGAQRIDGLVSNCTKGMSEYVYLRCAFGAFLNWVGLDTL